MTEHGHRIREFDVAYFMASVDTLEDNTAFAKKEEADFPLLADPSKTAAAAYGVLGDSGFARRWTFYIDKDGRIAHIEKSVKPATAAQDIVAKLEALGVARTK